MVLSGLIICYPRTEEQRLRRKSHQTRPAHDEHTTCSRTIATQQQCPCSFLASSWAAPSPRARRARQSSGGHGLLPHSRCSRDGEVNEYLRGGDLGEGRTVQS